MVPPFVSAALMFAVVLAGRTTTGSAAACDEWSLYHWFAQFRPVMPKNAKSPPQLENSTWYRPQVSSPMVYLPWLPLNSVSVAPVRGLVAVTQIPETGRPAMLSTTPVILPASVSLALTPAVILPPGTETRSSGAPEPCRKNC